MYHYIGDLIDQDIIIYCFFPHGSKKVPDLQRLEQESVKLLACDLARTVPMIMYDQEPLNFDLYENLPQETVEKWYQYHRPTTYMSLTPELTSFITKQNLKFVFAGQTIHDQTLLCHSEKNSDQIALYEQHGYKGVYWWSHAFIARDWFRYAQHDAQLLRLAENYQKDFNIYNRAWSGTREYRLKFLDLLIDNNLTDSCNVSFAPLDQDLHYLDHVFTNPEFKPNNDLCQIAKNQSPSYASADYSVKDYKQCWFEVILETLFDDQRIHLTEKTLRPIACNKPFILVGPAGSLEYLKSYGFQTFGDFFDESYDQEPNPVVRMEKILQLMKELSAMSDRDKMQLGQCMSAITRHNQSRFFSKEFAELIINELTDNVALAKQSCSQYKTGHDWTEFRKLMSHNPDNITYLTGDWPSKPKQDLIQLLIDINRARSAD